MHGKVGQHDKRTTKHGESDAIAPQSLSAEPERAENGGSGHFNVEPVLVVDK